MDQPRPHLLKLFSFPLNILAPYSTLVRMHVGSDIHAALGND